MDRTRKAWLAASSLALLLAACSSGGATTSSAPSTSTGASTSTPSEAAPASAGASAAAGAGELVVWADNSANTAKAIEPLCQAWAAENGVTCTVKKFNGGDELKAALVAGNASGDVPDLFEGPHDWVGGLVRDGVLAPIDLASNKANFSAPAVAGVTWDGSTYGVPWAVENVALLTNKDLAPTCPATLDEAVTNAKKLIADGKATNGLGIAMQIGENGDAYHWYPLFTADGGYAFGRNPDGTYIPTDMGVGKEGSIAAAKRLEGLVKDGILKASVSYDIARETFAKGKSPYFITGPWQIPEQTKALGDKLMVCPVPNWEGSTFKSQPFLGVRTFMQPAKAAHPVIASTFVNDEVMSTEFMDGMFAVDPRPPAWLESFQKAATDPVIEAFGSYGQAGIPMPSIPQMAAIFKDLGLAEYKIATGDDPEPTIVKAGESIDKQNSTIQ
jgi:arabinogalactan oligomer / maltooligosaccharide transport system substrate-binding protein